jgi:hypothetical protein
LLPFLKRKDQSSAGLIIKQRAPDEKHEEDQDDSNAAPTACMQSLINAIHGRDATGAVEALKDLMEVLDSPESSDEARPEPHSFEAQNIKAGE